MKYWVFISYFVAVLLTIFILFLPYFMFSEEEGLSGDAVRVMTYSSFLQEWGAGTEIARLFELETGIKIKWINAGNAGLLIERLKFKRESDQPDLVIGFDQFSIEEARYLFDWMDLRDVAATVKESLLPTGAKFHDFLAYDWGPMSFVYREGENQEPKSLTDLLDKSYRNKLILQDPRMSSPGLQFFLWVLAEMGEEEGFKYLEALKPSIRLMSPSWSSSYSIFKLQPPALVFSYFTSPYFHQIEENDESYRVATFKNPHPVQVEYAGVPQFCNQCDKAKRLAQFLLRKDIQKILMEKNYMYPVEKAALEGSPFKLPEDIEYYDPIENRNLIKRKKELVNRWKKVFY